MRLKIILFNLSIIIFLICLIYLYIYVNYKYEGFIDSYQAQGNSGEVFRAEGVRKDPITEKTTVSNALNESDTIAKINPKMDELEKVGNTEATAISARIVPYFNVSRAASSKPPVDDGYYWVDFNDNSDLMNGLTSFAGATLNPIPDSKDQYLLYKSSGVLVLRDDYICDILVVGGGGSGGNTHAGGGGGGAVVYLQNQTLKADIYDIYVGNGGKTASYAKANDGENSSISKPGKNFYLAQGGGGGFSRSGGNGGGAGFSGVVGGKAVNNNVPTGFYGNDGGRYVNNGGIGLFYGGAGGGGSGKAGENAYSLTSTTGNGGDGVQIAITGTPTYYGGGGGGGSTVASYGIGGLGGGGKGGYNTTGGTNGTPNTGGGGGGGGGGYPGPGDNGGAGGSGVIIIRLKEKASIGKKYTYCLMDRNYFGGGWMLAMRAVRGSRTFSYNSEHWTNATTMNDTFEKIRDVSVNADMKISSIGDAIFNNYEGNTTAINNYDAKYEIFNKYKAKEWMAIFYFKNNNGVVLKGGDIITGGNQNAKGWIWRETNLIETDNIERSPLQLFQKRNRIDRYLSLIDLRGNYGVKNAKELDKFKPVSRMPQLWSSQHGYNFYGINYDVPEVYENRADRGGASTRWGFAWNENWDYANNNTTNDVYGGIGIKYQSGYSAGDFIYCCEEAVRGVNSSIAFEWYVR